MCAVTLLERASKSIEPGKDPAQPDQPIEAADVALEYGRRLITRGQLADAQRILEQAATTYQDANTDLLAAAARRSIADILYLRGEIDQALRVRRKKSCPSTGGSATSANWRSPGGAGLPTLRSRTPLGSVY
jgi:hypothetical protein